MNPLITTIIMSAMICASSAALAGAWSIEQRLNGMDVYIYTPDSVSPVGNGRSAMIVMHGCAQTGDDYRNGANLEVAAETWGMVIATPTAPNGGVGLYGCWDYYDSNHTRNNRHNDNLIGLGQYLANRADVDASQVYIAGLSSGATQAQITACLAPDVFAGMGSTGGPVMGTSESQAFLVAGSASTAASLCENWAGSNSDLLQTQMRNIAHGSSDSLVPYAVAETSMQGLSSLRNISKNSSSTTIQGGIVESWGNGDITKLSYTDMDHRWAAGGDAGGGTYIDNATSRRNYADFLGEFFVNNNVRVLTDTAPVMSNESALVTNDQIAVQIDATDDSALTSVTATLFFSSSSNSTDSLTLVASGDTYSGTFFPVVDGLYDIIFSAIDDAGKTSETSINALRVGPQPAASAPIINDFSVATSGNCATAIGVFNDTDNDVVSVAVSFDSDDRVALISGNNFSVEACALPAGQKVATALVTDLEGLTDSASAIYEIDAVVTDMLSAHINAGRLDYTSYSTCYLEYGVVAFQLNEVAAASACRWEDNDASCTGPDVACTGDSGNGDSTGDDSSDDDSSGSTPSCSVFTATNDAHVSAGRALVQFVNLHYAVGSVDYLGLSYMTTTLSSNDGSSWSLGGCS